MIRVRAVEPLHGHTVRVTFTNDEQRDIDVSRYIDAGGIFAPIHDDPTFFMGGGVARAAGPRHTALYCLSHQAMVPRLCD
jgi:hypothetical protein